MIEALIALSIVLSIAVIALLLYFRSRMAAMGKESEQSFRIMAAESLERNARTLQQNNAEQLVSILSPLRMRIEDFNREMEKSYTDAAASRRSLSDQIERLTRLNLTMEKRRATSPPPFAETIACRVNGVKPCWSLCLNVPDSKKE